MNKKFLSTLTVYELKQKINRLHIGLSQLIELQTILDEENQELHSTKDMLIKTLTELSPLNQDNTDIILSSTSTSRTDLSKTQIKSEDPEEWNKIMQELK